MSPSALAPDETNAAAPEPEDANAEPPAPGHMNAASPGPDGAGVPDQPRRPAGSWWEKAVAAAAGVLIPLLGLPFGKILVFGLFGAMMLPWAVLRLRPAWGRSVYLSAAALSVVLAAFALTVLHYQSRSVAPLPPPVKASAKTPRLRFIPVTAPVAHCVSLSGTGRIPGGQSLVVFDRPTDSAGHYTPGSTFSFDEQAESAASSGGWSAPGLDIGAGDSSDLGTRIAVVAVLMPQHTADFLDTLANRGESGAFPRSVVTLGTTTNRMVLVRNAENAQC